MLAHEGYGKNSEGTSHGGVAEKVSSQSGFDQDKNDDEAGFGLGLLGLASPTLPSDDMMVPPLNFSMVRRAELMNFCDIVFCYLPCGTTVQWCAGLAVGHSLLDAVRTFCITVQYSVLQHLYSILYQVLQHLIPYEPQVGILLKFCTRSKAVAIGLSISPYDGSCSSPWLQRLTVV